MLNHLLTSSSADWTGLRLRPPHVTEQYRIKYFMKARLMIIASGQCLLLRQGTHNYLFRVSLNKRYRVRWRWFWEWPCPLLFILSNFIVKSLCKAWLHSSFEYYIIVLHIVNYNNYVHYEVVLISQRLYYQRIITGHPGHKPRTSTIARLLVRFFFLLPEKDWYSGSPGALNYITFLGYTYQPDRLYSFMVRGPKKGHGHKELLWSDFA